MLCFDRAGAETALFFSRVRRLVRVNDERPSFVWRKHPGATPRIGGYIDFSKLQDISVSAAVVLAADYDRARTLYGEIPPTIDLHTWHPSVLTTLYELGFFETLGHIPEEIGERLVRDGQRMTMKIVSAEDAGKLPIIDTSLTELAGFLAGDDQSAEKALDHAVIKLVTSISEAITNVTQHAYPLEHEYRYEHIGRLWVSATADRDKNSLTVVVYDQGATIPVTYPRMSRKDRVIKFLRRALVESEIDYANDGTYIRAAMRYGGSRTDESYRGKGFPQMFSLMKAVGGGTLTIRSRHGWCWAETAGRVRSGLEEHSLGGTLVELSVNLGRYLAELKDDD